MWVNRKNVHVAQRDSGWGTLREGGERATQMYDTQAYAIQAGRKMPSKGEQSPSARRHIGCRAHCVRRCGRLMAGLVIDQFRYRRAGISRLSVGRLRVILAFEAIDP